MSKVWVLDTETKGTGAEMVPLETLLERRRSASSRDRIEVICRKPDRRPKHAAEEDGRPAAEPHRFKVADAGSGRVLADDAEAREAVAALQGLRSVVDARIDVRDPATGDWRPLSMGEKKVLWGFRPAIS
jgi:hypothetical protein